MKTLQISLSITLMLVLCSVAAAQTGVARTADAGLANRPPNSPKHDQVAAVFPGHRFALEVVVRPITETVNDEERIVPTVFAFAADAHFEPIRVDAREIRLNFVVDRRPRSFILRPVTTDPRAERNPQPQSIFESKDPDLARLISNGWQGNATATMVVGRVPFNARLVQAKDIVPCVH